MKSFAAPPWFSISAQTQTFLLAAAQTWEDTQISEQYIQQALAQPNIALDVLVSAYRYYFYKNQRLNSCFREVVPFKLKRVMLGKNFPPLE